MGRKLQFHSYATQVSLPGNKSFIIVPLPRGIPVENPENLLNFGRQISNNCSIEYLLIYCHIMLERDYIMRLILQFFEALEKLKEEREKGKEEATLQQDTGSMYRCYFQQSERFFYEQDVPFIMHYLGTAFPPQELLQRIEILAELFYFDASLKKSDAERNSLLKKALELLQYLDTHSNTFSLERRQKIREISETIYQ